MCYGLCTIAPPFVARLRARVRSWLNKQDAYPPSRGSADGSKNDATDKATDPVS